MSQSELTNDIGYLLHHLALALDRQSELLLQERLDIGFSQFKILMALQNNEGIQQKEIAQSLSQTEASVSRQLKMLQEIGYVTCEKGEQDRRQHITRLTPKGERLIAKAMSALNRYHQPVFDELTPPESEDLQNTLRKLHDRACRGDRPGGCN